MVAQVMLIYEQHTAPIIEPLKSSVHNYTIIDKGRELKQSPVLICFHYNPLRKIYELFASRSQGYKFNTNFTQNIKGLRQP